VEVRQFDVVVAKGATPSATADMNQFLTIPVPQGVRYQVVLADAHAAGSIQKIDIAPTEKDAFLRVNLEIPR
jgi:hypothetical protein